MICSRQLLAVLVFAILTAPVVRAEELTPSFPNHALKMTPVPAANFRAAAPRGADVDTPFTWDQTAVVYENSKADRIFRGFDPMYNPLQFSVLPAMPTYLNVLGFDGNLGIQSVHIANKSGGNTEVFQFRVTARGIQSDVANYIYDIRPINTRVRTSPAVAFSANRFIKPGQIVKYTWTTTSNTERFPKCEAELSGRTGPATGLSTSVITSVLGVKVQPIVLGHYLMLVTPRDVRGEPPRGSTGNGLVFRCVFGSDYLPPVADGFSANTFTPAVNQPVTLTPNLTDPQTGQTAFDNQTYEFGDGSIATNVNGATTHTYTAPGIYRVRCNATVTPVPGTSVQSTAEDTVIVGGTTLPRLAFTYVKSIPPEEAGDGFNQEDSIQTTFLDPSGIRAAVGDRLIFVYNRNHFGRVSASDNADDIDIVLGAGKQFSGKTRLANNITIKAAGSAYSIKVTNAQLDRTGDPRLGACYIKGIFTDQRIALCIIPADQSTPRVLVYKGNMQGRVKGGVGGRFFFIPEERITGVATIKDPNPRVQQP